MRYTPKKKTDNFRKDTYTVRYCLLGAVPPIVVAVAVRFVLGIRRIIVFQVR